MPLKHLIHIFTFLSSVHSAHLGNGDWNKWHELFTFFPLDKECEFDEFGLPPGLENKKHVYSVTSNHMVDEWQSYGIYSRTI